MDEELLNVNFLAPVHLTKALLPFALKRVRIPSTTTEQIATCDTPVRKRKNFDRMSTLDIYALVEPFIPSKTGAPEVVQQSNAITGGTNITLPARISAFLWGRSIRADKTFHVVNTASMAARVGYPGKAAYSAAKAALVMYFNVLKMEVDGHAFLGDHATEVIVTNCLPGDVATAVLKNTLLTDGNPAEDDGDEMSTGLNSQRCAELMLRAASNGLSECWISKQPGLVQIYASYYTPWIWKYLFYRFQEIRSFLKVLKYNYDRVPLSNTK